MLVRSHERAVDAPKRPLDLPRRVQLALEPREQLIPEPIATPAPEARIDGLPWSVAVGQIAPWHAGVQPVEHPIKEQPMLVKGATARRARGQQGLEECPLLVGQFMTTQHGSARRQTTDPTPHITHYTLSNTA
jgi:hypothetical protein